MSRLDRKICEKYTRLWSAGRRPLVPNSSRQLYQMFVKKGMQKEDAFFAVLDHFNDQHWSDRNRYGEEIKYLKAEVDALRERIAKIEKEEA